MIGYTPFVTDIELFENTVRCFTVAGPRRDLRGKFVSFRVPEWQNGFMAPVFLRPGRVPTPKDLTALERRHSSIRNSSPYCAKFPYFNLLQLGRPDRVRQARQAAREQGWEPSAPLTFNVWTAQTRLHLPANLELVVGSYRNRSTRIEATGLINDVFGLQPSFMRAFTKVLLRASATSHITTIRTRAGKPCATGIVATWRDHALFLSGCVAPRYRNRGLWHSLVAARQAVSASHGATFWLTVTRNPHIAGKSTRHFKADAWSKKATTA